MTDTGIRVVVVLGVVATSVAIGLVIRSGSLVRRVPVHLPGMPVGLVLFTSEACGSCAAVRSSLLTLGVSATEVVAESAGARFPRKVVDRVPALAMLDEDGRGWIATGVPSTRRIRRWVDGP